MLDATRVAYERKAILAANRISKAWYLDCEQSEASGQVSPAVEGSVAQIKTKHTNICCANNIAQWGFCGRLPCKIVRKFQLIVLRDKSFVRCCLAIFCERTFCALFVPVLRLRLSVEVNITGDGAGQGLRTKIGLLLKTASSTSGCASSLFLFALQHILCASIMCTVYYEFSDWDFMVC